MIEKHYAVQLKNYLDAAAIKVRQGAAVKLQVMQEKSEDIFLGY